MANVDKVINGLEFCLNTNGCTFGYNENCPYYDEKHEKCNKNQIMSDALELLKKTKRNE